MIGRLREGWSDDACQVIREAQACGMYSGPWGPSVRAIAPAKTRLSFLKFESYQAALSS